MRKLVYDALIRDGIKRLEGMDDILQMDGRYLKSEETHMCSGEECKHEEIGE